MNDSPVVSEPDPSAARVRHRTLLRWRAHGAEAATVALGTAAVGMQAYRTRPSLTDDAAVVMAAARALADPSGDDTPPYAGNPVWLRVLAVAHRGGLTGPGGDIRAVLALLCFAVALWALTGTMRNLLGRRAWALAPAAAAVVALCPPAMSRLFSGTGDVLTVPLVALTVRVLTGAAARGRLPSARTGLATGLLAGLFLLCRHEGPAWADWPVATALLAGHPMALALAGQARGTAATALRGVAAHLLACMAVAACVAALPAPWPFTALLPAVPTTSAGWASALASGSLLGACAAVRLPLPLRIGAATVGALIALPVADLPSAVALTLSGAVLLAVRSPAARLVGTGTLGAAATALLWPGVPSVLLPLGGLAAVTVRCLPGRAARAARRPVILATVLVALAAGAWHAPPRPYAEEALCFTEARYGRVFAAYAEHLGLRRSTVALASPGGVLAVGEQRVVDLSGRTDPRVAAARAAGDAEALRRHLFVRARPEFVHVGAAEAERTGLTADILARHGYRRLLREGAGGDYVHRSAITAPERLPALRAWARSTAPRLGGSPVRTAYGNHHPSHRVGHPAGSRTDERTCTS